MGFKDVTGRVEVVTDIDTFDCSRLQPRTPMEVAKEARDGPLYRIITSFSMRERVEAKMAELYAKHGQKCRVEVITSKKEIDALSRGEFRVRIDGDWLDEMGEE